MNFFHFLFFTGDFFTIFSLEGEFFTIFFPLRLNSLQFSPFKSDIFAIFTFLRYFLGERDIKLLLQWWIPWTFGFYLSDWGFSFWNSACVLFCHKSPIFFWVICWHFLFLNRVPWCDWSRRLIDWSIKRALRVFQSLNLCQQKTYGHIICGAVIRWGRNCSEILRQIITINIYFFMTLKVTSLRILHIYYIQMLALCETCTNNHLGTLRQQVKKLNWNGLHIQAFWELLRQTIFSSSPPVNSKVTLYSCRPRKFSLTTSS